MTEPGREHTPIGRDVAERVIRRAIEADSTPDEGLHPEALVAAAAEVGIDPAAVREAIAVEQLGASPDERPLDMIGGPGFVVVETTIDRPANDTLDLIDAWLRRGHHLRRDHDVDTGAIWRKRSDVAASLQRTARSVTGEALLGTARAVHADVVPVDERRCVVRLSVDRRVGRSATVTAGATIGTTSIVSGVAAASIVPVLGVIAVPGVAVAGGMSLAARRRAQRLERELRRLAADVRDGRQPDVIWGAVARRIGLLRS